MRTLFGIRSAVLVIASVLVPGTGGAQQSNLEKAVRVVEQQARSGKGEFVTYLTGAAAAYRWASTTGSMSEGTYCPPRDLALDGRSYARIAIEEYKAAKSEYLKLPQYPLDVLSFALLRGLGKRFPCQSTNEKLTAIPDVAETLSAMR